jgi:DNA-binding HxlR family transcriptional regulator
VIGDRWVLLILRELSMGDKRFTDIRNDLRGIAPNLLSERLRSLQTAGVVETAELPPPAARTVYRLTTDGRAVLPVLRSVARFGARFLSGEPSVRFDARRAAHALLVPWWRASEAPLRTRIVVERVVDGAEQTDTVDIATGDVTARAGERVRVEEPSGTPDVTVHVALDALAAARRDDEPVVARLTGSAAARRQFLHDFDLTLA